MKLGICAGDLIKAFREQTFGLNAIAHVTNCQGVMGSGVAAQIKHNFPDAFKAYTSSSFGTSLGSISLAEVKKSLYVFNLNAQDNYGREKRHLNYEALYLALDKMKAEALRLGLHHIGVPYKMGSDRAGGDWNVVVAMIDSVFNKEFEIQVTAFKL